MREDDPNGKLKAVACLGVVLQVLKKILSIKINRFNKLKINLKGPFEVGSAVIVKNNLINIMLDLADSDDPIQEVISISKEIKF